MIILLLFTLIILVNTNNISSQEEYKVNTIELLIYRDGIVKVTQEFTISVNIPAVSIPMLSPSIQNIIIVDQLNSPLSFDIRNNELSISTLNATSIMIEYDTAGFTTREGPIWTISLNSTHPITASLPEGSTIIFLNKVPSAITTDQGKNVLVMPEGALEFSYILPLIIPEKAPESGLIEQPNEIIPIDNSMKDGSPSGLTLPILQLLPLITGIFFIAIIIIIILRRRKENKKSDEVPQLRNDDLEVLKFIEESGGTELELNIRKKFLIPKSSSWRLIRRLERFGYVKVTKVGVQNQVELIRKASGTS